MKPPFQITRGAVILELAGIMKLEVSACAGDTRRTLGQHGSVCTISFHTTHSLYSQRRFWRISSTSAIATPALLAQYRTSRSQARNAHHRAQPSACASRVPKISAWLHPGGAQSPYLQSDGRQQPETRMHDFSSFRARAAALRWRAQRRSRAARFRGGRRTHSGGLGFRDWWGRSVVC